ncbi:MAG: hypothetical protein L0206_07845 [Actinobacteria bacterium]|nr:hypothetical protein [Actinomycetota bacterium]
MRTLPHRGDVIDGTGAGGRPVLLATLGVPFEEAATVFAVDTAVESGERLVVANVTALEPLRMSLTMGYDALEEFTPRVSRSLRRTVELARSLGVSVERLRVRSPRPLEALVELVAEIHPGVLVFGPDRSAMRSRRYRKAVRAIVGRAGCLVWLPPDAAVAGSAGLGS